MTFSGPARWPQAAGVSINAPYPHQSRPARDRGAPKRAILPRNGCNNPARSFEIVVLPAPFEPSNPCTAPVGTFPGILLEASSPQQTP